MQQLTQGKSIVAFHPKARVSCVKGSENWSGWTKKPQVQVASWSRSPFSFSCVILVVVLLANFMYLIQHLWLNSFNSIHLSPITLLSFLWPPDTTPHRIAQQTNPHNLSSLSLYFIFYKRRHKCISFTLTRMFVVWRRRIIFFRFPCLLRFG